MTDLSDLQKLLAIGNYPVHCPPEKTLSEYADEWEQWFEEFRELFSRFASEYDKQVHIERKVVEDFLERHCFCTKETRKLLLEAQKEEAKT